LASDELTLLELLPPRKGSLLLLGVGGGREAITLAKMGYDVTGVDFVPAMVERAKTNAQQRGVTIQGFSQEISKLDVPINTFDVVWISRSMYSCIPTRARRVEMVRRINKALKPGGYFICQFHWNPRAYPSRKVTFLRRLIAFFTLGNFSYENGDMLWLNVEYLHAFGSEEVLKSELEEGGFTNINIKINSNTPRAGAVCQKKSNIKPLYKEQQ
jgi:SAM-dependent methyltransferase